MPFIGGVEILIVIGAVLGGFVSGLTGFGTGITALPVWLYAVSPALAAPLVVVCSLAAQLQTIHRIRHAIDWRRILPFIAGGALGVPIGTAILPLVEVEPFRRFVGLLLITYCVALIATRTGTMRLAAGRFADGCVGLAGGVLGGLAGLSGIPPILWSRFRSWDKDAQRSLFQVFNLTILALSGVSMAVAGFVTGDLVLLALVALPGTILGAFIGRRLYDRLETDRFNTIVLALLGIAGLTLVLNP
ncbi:MAG: sulfite exporter TauE/SafE family protein [Pseudomonadota bacterium]